MRWLCVVGWLSVAGSASAQECDAGWPDACVDPTASIDPTAVIADGASVGAHASVGPRVDIGDAVIAARAVVDGANDGEPRAVVGDDAVVGRRAHLGLDADIGIGVVLGRAVAAGVGLRAGTGATVGYGSTLGDNVTLGNNATIGSLVQVGDGSTVSGVVSRGVTLGSGVTVSGVVGPDVRVGAGATVAGHVRKDARVEADALVPATARVGRGAVVGYGVALPDDAVVAANGVVPDCVVVDVGTRVGRGQTLQGADPIPGCSAPISDEPRSVSMFHQLRQVQADAQGNLYVAFTSFSANATVGGQTVSTGMPLGGLGVVKLDPDGTVIWGTFGPSNQSGVEALEVHGDAVYVAYTTRWETAWPGLPVVDYGASSVRRLAKLDAVTGAAQWTAGPELTGGQLSHLPALAADDAGVYVGGLTDDSGTPVELGALTAPVEAGAEEDAILARISADGVWQWVRRAGTSRRDELVDIAIDNSGNALVLWELEGGDVVTAGASAEGREFALGLVAPTNGADLVISRVSPTGEALLSHQLPDGGNSRPYGISVVGSDVYILGTFRWGVTLGGVTYNRPTGRHYPFLTRLNPDLTTSTESRVLEVLGSVHGLHLTGGANRVFVTFHSNNQVDVGGTVIPAPASGRVGLSVAAYDLGVQDWDWIRSVSGTENISVIDATAVHAGGRDHVWVGGYNRGAMATDALTLPNNAYFVVHLDQDGDW